MSVTLSTIDSIFRDMYLPVEEDRLKKDGYTHECGDPYTVGVHNADGKCFRWVAGQDAWEASVFLLCRNPLCEDSPTSYIQGRFRFDGKTIAKLRARATGTVSFLKGMQIELNDLFDDFRTEISAATR